MYAGPHPTKFVNNSEKGMDQNSFFVLNDTRKLMELYYAEK